MKGEVRRRETKAGAALFAQRVLIVVLFAAMVFTLMPWTGPQGSVQAKCSKGILNNGLGGIYIDINSSLYNHKDWDIYGDPYGKLGCTWFVGARVKELTGKGGYYTQNPKSWYTSYGPSLGFKTGTSWPTGKAVIVYSGHVAFLEKTVGDTAYVSEGGTLSYYDSDKGKKIDNDAAHGYAVIHKKSKSSVKSGLVGFVYMTGSNPTDNAPIGSLSTCSTAAGTLTISGWAFDPDKTADAIEVHVYVDAKKGDKGKYLGKLVANKKNDSANKAYKCGTKHGFSGTLSTTKFSSGKHTISLYARGINKSGKVDSRNGNVDGCPKTVTFKNETVYTVNTGQATNINNTSATLSGSLTPRGNTTKWGFYLGQSETDMKNYKRTVSVGSTDSAKMTVDLKTCIKLKPGKKYYYKIWAYVNGKEKEGATASFITTAVKPEIPVLKIDPKSEEIGIGDSPVFTWNKVDQAEDYKLTVFDEDGKQVSVKDKIRGTIASCDALQKDGTYTAQIESYNGVGTKGPSNTVTFEVHPNVIVTFKDAESFADVDPNTYEPEILGTSEVAWGHDAELPAKPSHKGYTFTGWSEGSKAVEKNVTVFAEYEKNSYKVKFVDSKTGETLGEDTVKYYEAATPPDYSTEEGYVKLGYDGWDKDYTCITEDTTLYTCSGWYDDNLPIRATITNAVREYDTASSEDEGYTVTVKLQNWDQGTTKGRAVVALKTSEGKLLTSTESAAFNIRTSATKEIEVFVPYENAASIAEVFVVGQYKDAVPISTSAEFTIDQSNTMTSWSEEQPPAGAANVESKVEYRYSDKQTTTSYSTSLAGYTQSGSSWVKQSSGTIDYVPSFPSGFYKSSAYYTKYNGVKPKTASETATAKTTVSTSTKGYIYWHWCRGATSGPSNRLVSDCKEGSYTHWHSFWQTTPISFDSSAKSFYRNYPTVCKDSYWWMSTYAGKSNQLAIKTCTYNTYKKQFTYYKWTDWSAWSTTPVTANDNRKVQTRTVYRYQAAGAMDEDTSGTLRTVTGSVDSSFSGMEASLFIYKVNEASDFTNEYVDQTVIGPDGDYSFTFKLREEPTEETGDFTIALGIEGTTTPIFLDPKDEAQCSPAIAAPIKEYKVTFVDDDNTVLSTQTVPEHGNAELPDESQLQKEGYTFSKWSDTNMNVTEDRTIRAEYKKNTYTVVFVDWQAKTVSMDKFEYGAKLVAPQPAEPEEGQTVEWDKIADGVTEVTEDMIVTTRYKDKELNVTILDENGKVDEEKTVTYGMAVDLPEIQSTETKEFAGWADISSSEPEGLDDTIMTTNAILAPVFTFNETVANPTADLAQGEYDKAQTVTLSCDTPGASIYYTLDGSNPTSLNSKLYTGPITIDGPVELKFYASKFEMNDSDIQTRLYAVNYDEAISKWMLEADLPQEVVDNESAYHLQHKTGYRYKDQIAVTKLADAAVLEDAGWVTDPDADPVYEEFTNWSDTMPSDTEEYINLDVETEPVYTTADQFTYSHYVYEDGVTKYSPTEVDGFECTLEEIGPFEEPLYSSGKDAAGNRYYSYDGAVWYNQTETSGQIQTGTKYRWRAQKIPYTRWGEWTTTKPAEGVTDYETAEVFSYDRPDYHIVTVHYAEDTWSYLAEEGELASIDDLNSDIEDSTTYAYDVKGVYTDENYTNSWNLETDTITDSVDLYVKTEKKSFNVYFVNTEEIDTTEISEAIEQNIFSTQTVPYGEAAEEPEPPAKDGYVFVGWDNYDFKEVKYDTYVFPKYVPEDEYATVTLDKNNLTMYQDQRADLIAVVEPGSKADTELTWTSSDESVACVSDTGEVTGLGAGTAEITVKVEETGETATCTVTVKADNSNHLVLTKNDKLKVDAEGFLRGAKGNKDTVADILPYFDNANLNVVNMNDEAVAEDDLFGTGYKVQLLVDGVVKDVMEAVVTGDFTGDGSINNKDVAQLLRHLMDKVTPTDAQIRAADVNGNGLVDARDAVLTLRVIVGKDALD